MTRIETLTEAVNGRWLINFHRNGSSMRICRVMGFNAREADVEVGVFQEIKFDDEAFRESGSFVWEIPNAPSFKEGWPDAAMQYGTDLFCLNDPPPKIDAFADLERKGREELQYSWPILGAWEDLTINMKSGVAVSVEGEITQDEVREIGRWVLACTGVAASVDLFSGNADGQLFEGYEAFSVELLQDKLSEFCKDKPFNVEVKKGDRKKFY